MAPSPPKVKATKAKVKTSPTKASNIAETPRSGRVSKRPSKKGANPIRAKDIVHSQALPTGEQIKGNGRVAGRSLIVWSRPRQAEKLLQHIVYECMRFKVELPWDAIAHRFHPGSSGTAVQQHLNRMRKDLVAEGHLVPPPFNKAKPADPSIRGFMRADEEGDDITTVRPIRYDEDVPDRKFSLPVGDRVIHHSDVEGEDEQEEEEEEEEEEPEEQRLLPSMSVSVGSPEGLQPFATPTAYRAGGFEPQSGVKFTPSFAEALNGVDAQTPSRSSRAGLQFFPSADYHAGLDTPSRPSSRRLLFQSFGEDTVAADGLGFAESIHYESANTNDASLVAEFISARHHNLQHQPSP